MTEFTVKQDRDPELVEDEQVDDQLESLVDLPDYNDAQFEECPEDFDEDEEDEEEDGEPE